MMAARLRVKHQDEIREKIQVSNLITRVQKYALGELADEDISSNRLNAYKQKTAIKRLMLLSLFTWFNHYLIFWN